MEQPKTIIDLSEKDIELLNTKTGVQELLRNKEVKLDRVLNRLHYYRHRQGIYRQRI